ncbi:unnamed protein product, partial [Timema podura]|nr:unnamed protein product [Timema podura]
MEVLSIQRWEEQIDNKKKDGSISSRSPQFSIRDNSIFTPITNLRHLICASIRVYGIRTTVPRGLWCHIGFPITIFQSDQSEFSLVVYLMDQSATGLLARTMLNSECNLFREVSQYIFLVTSRVYGIRTTVLRGLWCHIGFPTTIFQSDQSEFSLVVHPMDQSATGLLARTMLNSECRVLRLSKVELETIIEQILPHSEKEMSELQDITSNDLVGNSKESIVHSTTTSKTNGHRKKQYTCKDCGQRLSSQTALKYHLTTHSGQRTYKCELCGKGFITDSNLNVHLKFHSGKIPCEFGRFVDGFIADSLLTLLLKFHSGEKPYSCDLCGKCFITDTHLTRHQKRRHSGEKIYTCDVCAK